MMIIGADFISTDSNQDLFCNAEIETLLGHELKQLIADADFRIFDLEAPFTDVGTPISKWGPCLRMPENCVAAYRALEIDLLTLANNHIMDQGAEGLHRTCKILDEAGIAHVGAGDTAEIARRPYFFSCFGKKIGVYACAEHEFSIVSDTEPGANPIDLLNTPDHISRVKADCDFLIVLYHGGKELYPYPSPDLQKICRKLVKKGADLVLCQHSHCIGCEEKYQQGAIVYGQGDFLFDHDKPDNASLLVQIDADLRVSYIPIVKSGHTVRLADDSEKLKILDDFFARSEEIRDPERVKHLYDAFAREKFYNYCVAISGINSNIFCKALNKLTGKRFYRWVFRRKFGEKHCLQLRGYMGCEAHRELMIKGLEQNISENR